MIVSVFNNFIIYNKVKRRFFFAVVLFLSLVFPSRLKADAYVDSMKMLISSLEQKNLTDTVLNTRLELIKYVKDSDYDLFLELAGQNILLAQKHQKNWALIDVYMEMGEVLVTKGIYGEALVHLNKAMNLAENDDYKPYKGWLGIAIGNAYHSMFNYPKCLEFYKAALDVFLETKNTDGIGLAATNLGTTYSLLKDDENAEYYLKMGLQFREELGNVVELGFTRMYYAGFKIRQGNVVQAETELTDLLSYLETTRAVDAKNYQFLEAMVLQAEVRSLLAECEKQKGNLKNEFLHLQKAVDIYKRINDDLHLSTIYNRIGYRYLEQGYYKEALAVADSANKAAEKAVVLTEQAYSLKIKSDAYSGLGKPDNALEAYKAYKEISDSIYNSSVIQAISNVDVLTKTMDKEKELLILSLELEQNRKMRLMIFFTAIVFLIVISVYNLLLYRRYKKEKQDGLILKEKNQQISEQAANLEMLNQKLMQLNKSKDKFHTIIAHDLKSPIAAFYSLFEMLHHSYDQLSDEDRKSFVDMAFMEVQRIMKLLDNLLTWSRIQGGHMNIRKSDFYIDETVKEVVSALKNMAELKEISFEVQEIEHVKIHADKEMIKAVIRNLCTNAIKFTPLGKKIRIGVQLSNKILEVFVQDDGIGIPKNKLDVLFDIDSKVQRKGTNDEPGTGLGLQLCYEFIKLHNGEITVESVEGHGSCFAFKIPCEATSVK